MKTIARRISVFALLSLPLAGTAHAQDQQASQSATVQPSALAADQSVDGDIVFTGGGSANHTRNIHLPDNTGAIRIYATTGLTGSPDGAAMQFWGNGAYYAGQAYIDSGANNGAAIILRTAPTGGAITERLRINSLANVGIGTNAPTQKLDVNGSIKISGNGNGLVFPDGTYLLTAPTGAGGAPSGSGVITAINDPATTGTISDVRLSPNVGRINAQNAWSGQNTFVNGLSANGVAITNVGNPVSASDATNKAYTDANFVKFVPGAEQLSSATPTARRR